MSRMDWNSYRGLPCTRLEDRVLSNVRLSLKTVNQ